MKKIKWGIIGSGKIAGRFASDLQLLAEAELTGVFSRSADKLEAFSSTFNTRAFTSLEDLLQSDVDIIYVATPHSSHFEHATAALRAGKAVLCEKPFALNLRESEEIFSLARASGVFIMEAMWTRFFPVIQECLDIVREGKIGKVVKIETSFGYAAPYDPQSRIFNPELGGGSLLDVGVYTIAFTHMFLGEKPSSIASSAVISKSGVDETTSWIMKFPSGASAFGKSSVVQILENESRIIGTDGEIRIPKFWHPNEYSLNGVVKESNFPGMGFQFEAEEVMRCFRQNSLESALWGPKDTLAVMGQMDKIRAQR